jgi:hypothetical protein
MRGGHCRQAVDQWSSLCAGRWRRRRWRRRLNPARLSNCSSARGSWVVARDFRALKLRRRGEKRVSEGWCLNDELNDELCDRGETRCFCEASSKPCVRRQCQRCTMIKSSYMRDKLAWPQAQESRPLAVQVLT